MTETELKLEKMQREIDELKKEVEELQAGSYVEENSSGYEWYWIIVPIMALSIPIIAILFG
ncbi:hypothetical protein [Alkalicoccobacillus murimartini]|uniref:Uncharacterized protein n=1 Tax=Alkalicoccobacillus murimartini TaxID=171685 RepID=A0ABT9YG44_9BACI|nr:hypothetical protein [Alkalicoccobacillus murimartini]MDQ0206187.1 hypothetical protein [Alkalicoccobacillus murimartini]